ncbi:Type IV secretory protein VirB4 components [Legionella busanensis]|uniref:Type IV secretory protein VirB4 components n=1 Tax=Legionella busanensis TaxID=190655 RepID=A0A378KBN0_9GAMM|nr:conjugative transfer ATPase [Legionella busanensis]STX81573.1 Type IV secretory protein VirB4 components [Legionella busanensis]
MRQLHKTLDWVIGPQSNDSVLTNAIKKRYETSLPSLLSHWACVDFCDDKNMFLLADGVSVGSGFEIGDIAAEAASIDYIQILFERIKETFSYVVPLYKENPWVMQFFVQDEYSLQPVLKSIANAVVPACQESLFTADYLHRLQDLMTKMTSERGLFIDPKTDLPYRGRQRRIRLLFYRLYQEPSAITREATVQEHEEVIGQIYTKLKAPGLTLKRLTGKNYYQWWVRWFHPSPTQTKGDINSWLAKMPYPYQRSAGFNLANAVLGEIKSDDKGFYFDNLPHRVMYVDGLKAPPVPGLLSRERPQDNPKHCYAFLDKLPEGSMYTLSVVFSDDEAIHTHLKRLEKGIIGTSSLPSLAREDIKQARNELSMGNRLYWVNQAVLYRASCEKELLNVEKTLKNLFFDIKMPLIDVAYDLHPLNSYLNCLPFNFSPLYARKHLSFDRLMYASELACLLPVYGRFKGAKHLPCFCFFNRLGEPVLFDVLSHEFVSQNSHMALFASSGGGKSVLTGLMVNALMAMKNARIVLFEMGNSFDRLLVHCEQYGKKVSRLLLSKDKTKAVPLNPFCDAYLALPDIGYCQNRDSLKQKAKLVYELTANLGQRACSDEDLIAESRDYLSELALALRTMLTEANEGEEQAFTLADESLLLQVLSDAIVHSWEAGIPQMLTEHVVEAFKRRLVFEESGRKKERLQDMHDRLLTYVINPTKAAFFNVPTDPLKDFDIFHIDVSAMKDNKGQLALVMASLLPRILALAEATQETERPTFLVIDEAHLQFDIDVIVALCLLIAKVARKLGLWLVPVTQNISDLSSAKATKILSLLETWIVLGFNEQELADLQRFKAISPEQEALLRSIDSQKGLYAEAVVLGSRYQGLFRVIPPRYLLALLMTEKQEKATRRVLEQEHGILKAAELMAHQLENKTTSSRQDDYFFDDDFFS